MSVPEQYLSMAHRNIYIYMINKTKLEIEIVFT